MTELLFSLGLVTQASQVLYILGITEDQADHLKLDFPAFLNLLKVSQIKSSRGLSGNYLVNKNLHYIDSSAGAQKYRLPVILKPQLNPSQRNSSEDYSYKSFDFSMKQGKSNMRKNKSFEVMKRGCLASNEAEQDKTRKSRHLQNSKKQIKNFFSNFAVGKSKSPEREDPSNLSFELLMGNFRRKKILETLKNGQLKIEQKNQVLQPYNEFIQNYYSQKEIKNANGSSVDSEEPDHVRGESRCEYENWITQLVKKPLPSESGCSSRETARGGLHSALEHAGAGSRPLAISGANARDSLEEPNLSGFIDGDGCRQ